jgi:uncharacterized protein YcfJ
MKHLLKTTAVVAIVALSGCNAHSGGLSNKTKGALLGGVAGGFVGNQIGGGSGNAAATALGAVLGVIAGQSLSQDAPVQQPAPFYQTNQPYMSSGSCSQYTNQGARAACNRGIAERENQRQIRLEEEAYRAGRGR